MAQAPRTRDGKPADSDPTNDNKGAMNKVAKAMEPLAKFAPHAAAVAIIAWLIGLAFLYFFVDSEEKLWGRLIIIFGSIQAVAFAAFGALFGTQVQLQRVEKAEQQAEDAKDQAAANKAEADENRRRADDNADTMNVGKQLAAAVKAEAGTMALGKRFGFDDDTLNLMGQKESLRLARKLLPDN